MLSLVSVSSRRTHLVTFTNIIPVTIEDISFRSFIAVVLVLLFADQHFLGTSCIRILIKSLGSQVPPMIFILHNGRTRIGSGTQNWICFGCEPNQGVAGAMVLSIMAAVYSMEAAMTDLF
jgi:hypothetical protein